MGVHQRIDRVARRSLKHHLGGRGFPSIQEILHFEGKNGPDGIKRKSPGVDEPWHFIDPAAPDDAPLLRMVEDHIYNLAQALRTDNRERAAFEAAWLAHTVTDGLTPAHHYPFEEKIAELRGEGIETRTSVKEKIIMPGKTRREQLVKNWKYWGTKGVMISHVGFEHGIATVVSAQTWPALEIHPRQFTLLESQGYHELFVDALKQVDSLAMYDEFLRKGWTRKLARQTREILFPRIVEMVTLAWYDAVRRSQES